MELSGELTAGRFFSGINSLQFASPSIAAELEQAENFNGIYYMNAQDPASPAGLGLEGFEYLLCARSAGNRLYFRGKQLVALSVKNGKELQIFIGASDPAITELVTLLKIPRTRNAQPESKIVVETINGTAAAKSEYAPVFRNEKFISDRGRLMLW
jgi:ATP-dependent Lhr-like helicase